jgi:YfiH family protein
MHLKSELLSRISGVTHGFGTLGEPLALPFIVEWERSSPRWRQVHQVACAEVKGSGQECGEVDALWSSHPAIPIAVVTADCVPILLAHRNGRAVAAVHAGWRGTRAHILSALWSELAAQGEKPHDWVAAIGPAIGPCCYQVSEELAADFATEFANLGPGVAVPRTRILDLPAINAAELRQIGLAEVDLIRTCTRCSKDPVFHSYRREGGGTRQWSAIQIN